MAVVEGPELERWRRAARIAAEARERGVRWAEPGIRRRDLADRIEAYIRDQGAEPAFPANISRNVEAAHYTPDPDDEERLVTGDLVKIDVGAHLDGAIADTAMTVEVGGGKRHENLIRAVVEGLAAGVAAARAGAPVDDVSRAVEAAIHRRGVKPVHNLTGHSIDRYLLHAGKAIPNVHGMSVDRLEEGEIIAIEPFATNGAGEIGNGPFGNILRFRSDPGAAAPELKAAFGRFKTLPFALRWIADAADRDRVRRARRFLQTYPVFVEAGEGFVAQAEHTVRVGPSGAEVLTLTGA